MRGGAHRLGTAMFWIGAVGFASGLALAAIPATSAVGFVTLFAGFGLLAGGLFLRGRGAGQTE